MLTTIRDSKIYALIQKRNLLTSLLCGVILINLLQGMLNWYLLNRQKTILVPPLITQTLIVGNSSMSDEYIKAMGDYLANLMLNVTPENISDRHAALRQYFHPKHYGEIKQYLLKDEKTFKARQQSRFFSPTCYAVNLHEQSIIITGEERYLIGEKQVSNKVKKYQLQLKLEYGRVYITGMQLLKEHK